MGTKVYSLALFLFFVFNCREGRRSACSLAEGEKTFLITLAWRHLFFPSLHLLLEKLRHNSTHYIHSEDEKEHTCPLLLWKSIQPYITGCNSTHLIQKHILTLLSYMKGHHGCPFNSIAFHIFLSMKYLLRDEKQYWESNCHFILAFTTMTVLVSRSKWKNVFFAPLCNFQQDLPIQHLRDAKEIQNRKSSIPHKMVNNAGKRIRQFQIQREDIK